MRDGDVQLGISIRHMSDVLLDCHIGELGNNDLESQETIVSG
jgi:hypothetical protein